MKKDRILFFCSHGCVISALALILSSCERAVTLVNPTPDPEPEKVFSVHVTAVEGVLGKNWDSKQRRMKHNKNKKTDLYPVTMRFNDPSKIFFTSDTHFGDEKVLRLCGRPFSSVDEMDNELMRRWNETVPEDGIVFHLGDFGFGKYRRGHELLRKLNGRKYLIIGNHDGGVLCRGHVGLFEAVSQQMLIKVDGQPILLNHCPMLCFSHELMSMWQLFGHVHSGPFSTSGNDLSRLEHLLPHQYDVGVDNNNFTPVSFTFIKNYFKAQQETQSGRR